MSDEFGVLYEFDVVPERDGEFTDDEHLEESQDIRGRVEEVLVTVGLLGVFLVSEWPDCGLSQHWLSALEVDHLSLQSHPPLVLLVLFHFLVLLLREYSLSLLELVLDHLLLEVLFDAGVLLFFHEAQRYVVFFCESLKSVLGADYPEVH